MFVVQRRVENWRRGVKIPTPILATEKTATQHTFSSICCGADGQQAVHMCMFWYISFLKKKSLLIPDSDLEMVITLPIAAKISNCKLLEENHSIVYITMTRWNMKIVTLLELTFCRRKEAVPISSWMETWSLFIMAWNDTYLGNKIRYNLAI